MTPVCARSDKAAEGHQAGGMIQRAQTDASGHGMILDIFTVLFFILGFILILSGTAPTCIAAIGFAEMAIENAIKAKQ